MVVSNILAETKTNIDSLKQQLSGFHHDTTRVNLLLDIGDSYIRNNYLMAQKYYEDAFHQISQPSFQEEFPDFAYENTTYIYNVLAIINKRNSNYVQAIKYHNLALHLMESRRDTARLINEFHNLALFYFKTEDHKNAEENILKHLDLITASNAELDFFSAQSIGIIFHANNRLDSAEYYLEKALELGQGYASDFHYIMMYGNLASLRIKKEEFNEAKILLDRSHQLIKQIGTSEDSIRINLRYSYFFRVQNDLNHSLQYAQNAVNLAKKKGRNATYLDALQELSTVYLSMKNYKKVVETYDKLLPLKDVFLNDENSKEIGKLTAAYEYERQAFTDSISFTNQLEISSIKLENSKRQRLLYGVLALISLLGALLIALFFRNRHQQQEVELELKESRANIAEQKLVQKQLLLQQEQQQLRQEQLEKENLSLELRYKKKDIELLLSTKDLKNKLRSQILEELEVVLKSSEENIIEELRKLYRKIDHQIEIQEQFKIMDGRIKNADSAFEQNLIDAYPFLSKRERELCLYIRSDMSNKEIAVHSNSSYVAVKTMLYRIRKKLGFEKTEELYRTLKDL